MCESSRQQCIQPIWICKFRSLCMHFSSVPTMMETFTITLVFVNLSCSYERSSGSEMHKYSPRNAYIEPQGIAETRLGSRGKEGDRWIDRRTNIVKFIFFWLSICLASNRVFDYYSNETQAFPSQMSLQNVLAYSRSYFLWYLFCKFFSVSVHINGFYISLNIHHLVSQCESEENYK